MEADAKQKNLVLTGFMGTGKTETGIILARSTGRRFVDTDKLVEERAGKSVAEIFKESGEDYFRELESSALRNLNRYKAGTLVVSTGGGAVIRKENRETLRKSGIIINLTAGVEDILARTSETGSRPLLDVEDPEEKIRALLEERREAYSDCHISIDTTGLSPLKVAEKILRQIKDY